MKKNGAKIIPGGGEAFWEGGAQSFINKVGNNIVTRIAVRLTLTCILNSQGTNGRWQNVLTEEDVAKYEKMALEQLGEECSQWLAHGGHIN